MQMRSVLITSVLILMTFMPTQGRAQECSALDPAITGIDPDVVAQEEGVAVTVSGQDFVQDCIYSVYAECSNEACGLYGSYEGNISEIAPDGTYIRADFDFSYAQTGPYDVWVHGDPHDAWLPLSLTIGELGVPIGVYDSRPEESLAREGVHVTIYGFGFDPDAQVRLTHDSGPEVVADTVFVDPFTLDATFDLSGQVSGSWDLVVTNPDDGAFAVREDALQVRSGDFLLFSLTPRDGGNSGAVTCSIIADLLSDDITVKLMKGTEEITGDPLKVTLDTYLGDGRAIVKTVFNLTGKEAGLWDLVVQDNAHGTSATLEDAFTITEGGAPDISIEIYGGGIVHGGRDHSYDMRVMNSGNVDAIGIPAVVFSGLNSFSDLQVSLPPYPPDAVHPDDEPLVQRNDTSAIVFLPTTKVPRGRSVMILIRIKPYQNYTITGRWYE